MLEAPLLQLHIQYTIYYPETLGRELIAYYFNNRFINFSILLTRASQDLLLFLVMPTCQTMY